LKLTKISVSPDEILSVFESERSQAVSLTNYDLMVGLSNKGKFVVIAYQVAKNPTFDVEVLQIDLPYEEDIEQIWCTH
jgi:hypothetical protein